MPLLQIRRPLKTLYSLILSLDSKLLNKSDVFCMSPWIQLHAQTNGKVAPCCMAAVNDGNEIGDLRQNPNLEDAWNSGHMKQLRLDMLHGKKNSLCTNCYKYEELGRVSERMQYNRDYKHYFSRIKNTGADGSLPVADVPLIDIRFSNKCNYKCRICSSEYSSLWYEEEQKLGAAANYDGTKEMKVAGDDAAFWQSYKKMLPHVRRIHFAGGEPLFMDEHYQALEHLIAIDNKDVILSYNTNFSTLRYKKYDVTELWNKFKKVDVWASLDGMFEKGDYQRKGQKWAKIEENIRTVQQHCPNVLFGVNVTVSIFNILSIPEFYRYMVDNKLVQPGRMNLYLLFEPDHFRITHLTPALKHKVIQQFEDFEKNYLSTLPHSTNISNHVNAVITFMQGNTTGNLKPLHDNIKAIDAIRGENFTAIFPELEELMRER